jgi:hypothetical protein
MFAARERWLNVPVPTVARIGAALREGASPAELTGALARDPVALRAEALSGDLGRRTSDETLPSLYRIIRPYLSPGSYASLAKTVNVASPSKFMPVKQDARRGEPVAMGAGGVAAGEALLLHSALVAKARGKSAFAILPPRTSLISARVLFENPAEAKLPAAAFFDADAVVAALGPRFVPPPTR